MNHQKGHRTYPSNDDPFATLDPNASLEEKHSVRVLRKLRERARRRQQALQKIRERQERLHRARIAIKRPNNQRERIEAARRKTELATLERKRNAMMAELRSLENKRNAEQAKLQRIRQDAKLAKKSADTYKALAERMKAEAKRQRTLAAELKKQHDARMRLLRHMTSKERRRIGEERRLLAQMRKQQKRELHALQKQREAETKRLGELRRLAKRQNKLIARQKKLIARQRRLRSQLEHNRAANNTTLRRSYEKQLAMLRTETTQLKSQLSTISQRSQSLQNQEKQTQTAQSHFNRGEIEQARKLFSSSNQNEQLRLLDDFFKDYREGKSAYQRKTPERAIPALKSALRHDLELGGGKSVYTKRIRRMLATLYTAQGSREMSRSSYPLAYLYFSNARHYSPKHPTIRDALSRLRKLAQQQYLLAQQQSKRPAIARSKLLKVMRMVDATDPLYKKAERMLERIN